MRKSQRDKCVMEEEWEEEGQPAKTIKGVNSQWDATDEGSREAVKDYFGFQTTMPLGTI